MKRYDQIPGSKSIAVWKELQKKLSTGMSSLAYQLPIVFEKAKGDILYDIDGHSYIDWDGGVLTSSTGHCNERVTEKLKKQLDNLWNIHDYPTTDKLAAINKLSQLLPKKNYVFQFYSGGSETVEAAIRAALSFQKYRKRKILSFSEGYHGKTRGSLMAVHALFGKRIQPDYLCAENIPFPKCHSCPYQKNIESCNLFCAHETIKIIQANKNIGLFVFEPILGTGGIFGPPDGFWDLVQPVCKQQGILLIADEITTGAFRTGTFLSVEQFGIEPDLIAFGKGIASGFPAIVLAGEQSLMQDPDIDNSLDNLNQKMGVTFTAPGGSSTTFGGSPLAMAAINATLDEMSALKIGEHVSQVSKIFEQSLGELQQKFSCITDIRIYGLLIGVSISVDPEDQNKNNKFLIQLNRECAHHGLFIKFDSNGIIHITPPLTISEDNVKKSLEIFGFVLSKLLTTYKVEG
jgi:4-aminobutyrate aminotransferase-like enzyme